MLLRLKTLDEDEDDDEEEGSDTGPSAITVARNKTEILLEAKKLELDELKKKLARIENVVTAVEACAREEGEASAAYAIHMNHLGKFAAVVGAMGVLVDAKMWSVLAASGNQNR